MSKELLEFDSKSVIVAGFVVSLSELFLTKNSIKFTLINISYVIGYSCFTAFMQLVLF